MSARQALIRSVLVSAGVLLLDQLTKFAVHRFFAVGESLPILPGVFHLSYVQNTGAAFGLFKGKQLLFIGFSLAVIAWMGASLRRGFRQGRADWASALILGGAAGNLIDRARAGHVIDFLDFRVWPVFNVADSALSVGVALLLWRSWRTRDPA